MLALFGGALLEGGLGSGNNTANKCRNPCCSKCNLKKLERRLAVVKREECCIKKKIQECQGGGGGTGPTGATGTTGPTGPTGPSGGGGPGVPPTYLYTIIKNTPVQPQPGPVIYQQPPLLFAGIIPSSPSDFKFLIGGIYTFEYTVNGSVQGSPGQPVTFELRSGAMPLPGSQYTSLVSLSSQQTVSITGIVTYKVSAGESIHLENLTSIVINPFNPDSVVLSLRIERIGDP